MKPDRDMKFRSASTTAALHRIEHETVGGFLGAMAGAVAGAGASLPGVLAGALMGGIAGVIAGAALDSRMAIARLRSRRLDEEIGVTSGDIGVRQLAHGAA
jgi:hypothetical protein